MDNFEEEIVPIINTKYIVNKKEYNLIIEFYSDRSVQVSPKEFLDDLLKYEIKSITIYPEQKRNLKGDRMIILSIKEGRFILSYDDKIKSYFEQ